MFGVVPGAPKVNQSIGGTPQIYMERDLAKVEGLTSKKGVSTGVIASEAAKWHAMTAALGMQSKAEIAKLKAEIKATGLVTNEVAQAYEALLPIMNEITSNFTKNPFDNSVVIIDEAHNLVNRIVNKLNVLSARSAAALTKQVTDTTPISLALYEMLMKAKNARIVLLSGTPIINIPINMDGWFHLVLTKQSRTMKYYANGVLVQSTEARRWVFQELRERVRFPFYVKSMSHRVVNDVDAEWVGDLLGKGVKVVVVFALALPAIAVVRIVQAHHHQPTLGVKDHSMVHLAVRHLEPDVDVRHLRFLAQVYDHPI